MITLKSGLIATTLLTSIGGIAGGVIYSMGLFNNPKSQKISELLNLENKYALLSTEATQDNEDWTKAWGKYIEDNQSREDGKDKWTILGWKKTGLDQRPKAFKDACNNKKINEIIGLDDPKYKDFVNYCTRPKTLQEALKKVGFKPLTGEDKDSVSATRFDSYKKSNNQLPNKKITSADSSKSFNDLKNGCTEALKVKTTDNNYSKTKSAVLEWCKE